MRRVSWVALLVVTTALVWWTLGENPPVLGRASASTAAPNATITTNQSTYSSGDRMVVTITVAPSAGSSGQWFPLVGLLTPATGTANELFIYRFDPQQEFLTLNDAVNRVQSDGSFARVAASPASTVTPQTTVILDDALPLALQGGFPSGSYTWVALMVSADASQTGTLASAPFTVQSFSSAALPSCGSSPTPFSVSPLAFSDITSILPLGNVAPPAHTFPTRHLYFHIRRQTPWDFTTPAAQVPVRSPGDVSITNIGASENLTLGTADFNIRFSPCQELKAYLFHVTSISQELQSEFVPPYDRCDEYTTGGERWRNCSKTVQIALSAGETIGTAGGARNNALDFGASDSRTVPLQFANPSRWANDSFQLHVVCAIDYFTSSVRGSLQTKLGHGGTARTAQPICGEVEQDELGTAQGVWFVKGTTQTYPEDPHLALIHDNVAPAEGVFSVGTSMSTSGLPSGAYYFTPTSSEFINRDFKQVRADGNVYCYEPTDKWTGTPLPSTVILLELIDPTTLRIEKQSLQSCGSALRAFGSNYTDFER